MKKRLFAMFLALTMALSLMPAALAEEEPDGETQASVEAPQNQEPETPVETPSEANTTYVAEVNGQQYETLQKAIDTVTGAATIKLLDNIVAKKDEIVTIPAGKTVTLDMAGKSITVESDFMGRPIVNEGTLTVTGNGTIDASASENGLGAINNKNTLTIDNGTYRGAVYASGSGIRNTGASAVLVIEDGVFEEATCAVYNEGTATIKDGTFSNRSCSACAKADGHEGMWSYVIRNATADSKMTIDGGTFTGIQGAASAAIGSLTVNDGYFKTVDCDKNHGAIFYALYAAGEVGEVETVINGGTFETEGKYTAVLIGNDNENGDGGINAQSAAEIRGGTFKAPRGVPAVKKEVETGQLSIIGGEFSSDPSQFVPDSHLVAKQGDKWIVGTQEDLAVAQFGDRKFASLADAVAAVHEESDDSRMKEHVIELLRSVDGGGFAVGYQSISNSNGNITTSGNSPVNITIDLGGNKYTVNPPSVGSSGTETNGFQFLKGSFVKICNGSMELKSGVKCAYLFQNYANLTLENVKVDISDNKPCEALIQSMHGIVNIIGNTSLISGDTYEWNSTDKGTQRTIKVMDWNNSAYGDGTQVTVNTTGTIDGSVYASYYNVDGQTDGTGKSTLTIKNGHFTKDISRYVHKNSPDIVITGGYFTSDPSAYCADGLTGIASGRADYPFTIGPKSVNKAEVAVAEPKVTPQLPGNASEEEKKLAEETETALNQAADSAAITGPAMDAAAVQQANQNQVTRKAAESALTSGGIGIQGQEVKVVIQTYMDIKITDASVEKDGDVVTKQTLTLDITPMYKTVATTAADLDRIETSGDQKNAVEITTAGTSGVLKNITGPVQVSISLPDGFVADTDAKVYVHHKGYEYAATVSQVGQEGSQTFVATFTNPHGFSKFTLSTTSAAVAKVNGNSYTSFQDAVNAAGSSDTIDVLQAGSYTASAGKTVKVKNAAGSENITVTINGETKTVSKDETVTFTYVPPVTPPQPDDRPSGGSDSSSSSDGDYIVSVDTGKHGTVTVSPKRADKGDTVTITVKPDKGYELDELVVTDKNGDAVKLKDKGNGKFSFTMPGSKVTVEAKFVKESASQLPFADVSADYWAYDEIAWAYENGYMNGTSATAFNPGGNVSRQQLWMILARLSGASPASMAEAREWAIGNGISDGSNPGGAISRQQMVATLYRYAKLMGYDTTGAADLTAFPDHASVADYAKEAMAWSVKNEIVGGTAQGTLNPAGTASRAQFAVILYRFVK